MSGDQDTFVAHVTAILQRVQRQKGGTSPEVGSLNTLAARLWRLVAERGLPRPLADNERGEPGGMPEEECTALVARVINAGADPELADGVRQLVKACFYPEFKACRNSFKEVAADGHCRRQELPRAARRVSGAHCVDCPHWVALTPQQHEKFLGRQWLAGQTEFAANQGVFLPEDFRAFRRWLYSTARNSRATRQVE